MIIEWEGEEKVSEDADKKKTELKFPRPVEVLRDQRPSRKLTGHSGSERTGAARTTQRTALLA